MSLQSFRLTFFMFLLIAIAYVKTFQNTLERPTQSSCDNFSCNLQGTVCQERNQRPECICRSCSRPQNFDQYTCGSDGNTYFNQCFLDRAACVNGIIITNVPCRASAATDQPPRILENPIPRTVFVGSSVNLKCTISTSPNTSFFWKKQGVEGYLRSQLSNGILVSDDGALLTIARVSHAHAGTYECLGKNNAGFVTIHHKIQVVGDERCAISAQDQARRCSSSPHQTYWSFKPDLQKCVRLRHRHCNQITNKFPTKWECEKICAHQCEMEPIQGSCRNFTQRIYFDSQSGTCQSFAYGGCDGNNNNFPHVDSCRSACVRELPGITRPHHCPYCRKNLGTSYCDDDFAIAGIITELSSLGLNYPYLRIRITNVFKDNQKTIREDNSILEFEMQLDKNCPCPDFETLLYERTLGSNDAKVIFTGKYVYGIRTVTQGSLAVEATSVNIRRMQSNKSLCSVLNRIRNSSRT